MVEPVARRAYPRRDATGAPTDPLVLVGCVGLLRATIQTGDYTGLPLGLAAAISRGEVSLAEARERGWRFADG